MIPTIIIEALALLLACWLLARWRARALRHQLAARELREQLRQQAAEYDGRLAETIVAPLPAPALAPAGPVAGRRSHVALGTLDVTDLLLVTEYARRRAEPGSAIAGAASRARLIAETAATDLGITRPLYGRGGPL